MISRLPQRGRECCSIRHRHGLPAEVVLDLAIDLVDVASRKIASSSVERTAIGLGAARWRNVSAKDRSEAMRKAVQARWAKARASKGGNG